MRNELRPKKRANHVAGSSSIASWIAALACVCALTGCGVRMRLGAFDFQTDSLSLPLSVAPLSSLESYGNLPVTQTITVSNADPSLDCDAAHFSVSSSDPTLVPPSNVVWSGTPPQCAATITANDAHTAGGTATLTLSVSDGQETVVDQFSVVIRPLVLPTVGNAHNSVIADFDQDGNNDVAIACRAGGGFTYGHVSVYYGRGDGTYDAPVDFVDPGLSMVYSKMRTADINADGFPDLISHAGPTRFRIYSSAGTARTWAVPGEQLQFTNTSLNYAAEYFTLADFNRDGRLDFIGGGNYVSPVPDRWILRLHDGSSSYTGANWGTAASDIQFAVDNSQTALQHVAVADLDGDTFPDVIGTTIGRLTLYRGDGVSTYSSATDLLSGLETTVIECAEPGDVDADGDLDLFVSYLNANRITLLKNDGAGNFAATHYDVPGTYDEGCNVADLNLDGRSDFLVSSKNDNSLTVLYANGSGGLDDVNSVSYRFTSTIHPSVPQVGDLNGDGCPDITVGPKDTAERVELFYGRGSNGSGGCLNSLWGTQIAPDPNAPAISAIGATVSDGVAPIVKSFTVQDADSVLACDSTSLSMSSSNPAVIPNANVVWSGTAPNCTATVTPASATASVLTLTFTVTDGALTDSESFTVTVDP